MGQLLPDLRQLLRGLEVFVPFRLKPNAVFWPELRKKQEKLSVKPISGTKLMLKCLLW